MLHKFNLECLDRFLQQLMHNNFIFGGKLLVVSGDFRQILPVIPRGRSADIINATVKSSYLWNAVTTLRLQQNMRINRLIEQINTQFRREELTNFAEFLINVGEGIVPDTIQDSIIPLPADMCCHSIIDLRNFIYDYFHEHFHERFYLDSKAVLASTNESVDIFNNEMIDLLPNVIYTSLSIDTIENENNAALCPTEFLNGLNLSGIPQHKLHLKKYAVIILMRNLNIRHGHCNGTRYIIEDIYNRYIKARKLSYIENDENAVLLIPRIPLSTTGSDFPFLMRRLQFPVRLAYALTFNKAQGQSLEKCGLLLASAVFTHGQLYVGLSRCGDPRNIKIYAPQEEFSNLPHNRIYAKNIVYNEILS